MKPRLVLIDDDPTFAAVLKGYADSRGMSLATYGSLVEMGGLASLGKFDVVLLDFNLEHLSGEEIAAYLDALLPNTPALLISSDAGRIQAYHDRRRKGASGVPKSLRGAVSKDDGPEAILAAVEQVWQAEGSPAH